MTTAEGSTTWSLEFTEIFVAQFKKLDKKDQEKTFKAIEKLKDTPLRHKALKGPFFGCYRIRIGWLRVIYLPDKNKNRIYLIDVDHRKKVYKRDVQRIIDQISRGTHPRK